MDEEPVTFNRPQRNDEMRAFHAEMLRQERRKAVAAKRWAERRQYEAEQEAAKKSALEYVKFDLGDGSTFSAPVVMTKIDWPKLYASTIVTSSSISGIYDGSFNVMFDEAS